MGDLFDVEAVVRAYAWMRANADIIVPHHDWGFFDRHPSGTRRRATCLLRIARVRPGDRLDRRTPPVVAADVVDIVDYTALVA
jgi:hypothetical protein